ncbi:MAG: diversity-generating retroelement protein Avd [Bacteroidales bacterium]|nr:diversity-generating retroelement protein Avd [Bacteroidales bacterium]
MAKTIDYPIFELWYKNTDWILDKCEKMPKNVRFSVANRIADLAVENIELITDAIYQKQKRIYLEKLNRNLEKIRILFRLSHDRRYISTKQYAYISEKINETGKMLGGWLKICAE